MIMHMRIGVCRTLSSERVPDRFSPGFSQNAAVVLDYRGMNMRGLERFLKVSFKEEHRPGHCCGRRLLPQSYELRLKAIERLLHVVPVVIRQRTRVS